MDEQSSSKFQDQATALVRRIRAGFGELGKESSITESMSSQDNAHDTLDVSKFSVSLVDGLYQWERKIWRHSLEMQDNTKAILWNLCILASNLCLYRRCISGNGDDGWDEIPEVCAKTRHRWRQMACCLNELVYGLSAFWGGQAYFVLVAIASRSMCFVTYPQLTHGRK